MADPRLLSVRGRQWADPAIALTFLRQYEYVLASADVPDVIRHLRTGPLKEAREARSAALFAHGLAHTIDSKVWVSPGELGDADFLTMTNAGGSQFITHWQLKELVPAETNASASLNALMAGLKRRPQSNTSLAVYLNRRDVLPIDALTTFRPPFIELWYFWCASEDQTEWFVFGDALKQPRAYRFTYPT